MSLSPQASKIADRMIERAAADPALAGMLDHAAHTVFRAYISAGCKHGADDLARGSLIWLGEVDPGPSPEPISALEYISGSGWKS